MSATPISQAAAALRVQIVATAEAELAAVVGASRDPLAATVETAAEPAQLHPVRQAVDNARADAAGRQAGLAPLFAELAQALRAPATPAAVRAAIGRVLALQTPATGPFTAESVRQAVAQSGLFLEARLAALPNGEPVPPDLKAALLTLRQALGTPEPGPAPRTAPAPPPPAREASLAPQPPAAATLSAGADAPSIARHLGREADQAIARQVLHQLASLPTPAGGWMFELPIATPQGAAVAQFEVDRDGARGGDSEPGWRVRFSIDVEPLGPVHVHLSAQGGRAAVTVWAENEASLERLRGEGAELARALPADVVFHAGKPVRPQPSPGGFVDRVL